MAHIEKPRWYSTEPRPGKVPCRGSRFFYVRKSHNQEGKVIVWNGRHFITTMTVEEARETFKPLSNTPCQDQEYLDSQYTWYLHY